MSALLAVGALVLGVLLALPAAPAAATFGPGGDFANGGTAAPGATAPGPPATGGSLPTLSPANPCGYVSWMTGPDMQAFHDAWTALLPAFPTTWDQHLTDPVGAWYRPDCTFLPNDGTPVTRQERLATFCAGHPTDFFTAPPATPPISVDDLITYATDRRIVPDPAVSTNPEVETVNGLRTWVWPTGVAPAPVVSRAVSGANWAEVVATPGRLVLSTPDAEVGSCSRAPAYTPGAPDSATDCYVEYRGSTARSGPVPITVSIDWAVTCHTSDGRNQVLSPAFPVFATVMMTVAEVQSVLR